MESLLLLLLMVLLLALCVSSVGAEAVFPIADFGAAADATTDDTAAIQAALDAASAAGGGLVQLDNKQYLVAGSLTIPRGVTLQGLWEMPHHAALEFGTTIYATGGKGQADGTPLINLMPDSAVKGMTFFYPEQQLSDIQPYPWTIQGRGMHSSVIDVTLVNSYQGIDFGTHPHELHYIRNVFGCPLKIGVYIDKCTDIGRVENVHFNPHYWLRSSDPQLAAFADQGWATLREYLFDNLTAFLIGRSDWEYIFNTFSFGAHIGYHFIETPSGATNGNFLGIASDWAWTSVKVDATQEPGLLITNGQFVGGTGSGKVIDITDGVVQLSNCAFWGPQDVIVSITGRSFASFSQCNFCHWDHSKQGVPAIDAQGGTLLMQSCRFGQDKLSIRLGPDVAAASLIANGFRKKVTIENNSKGQVELVGNLPVPY